MEQAGDYEEHKTTFISEKTRNLRNSEFALAIASNQRDYEEQMIDIPQKPELDNIFLREKDTAQAIKGQTQLHDSRMSDIEDELSESELKGPAEGNPTSNLQSNIDDLVYKEKIVFLENEVRLRDEQLLLSQQNIKDNERRVEDLLDLIQRERRQITEKELGLKEKEHSLQEYKRLKQLITVEKYEKTSGSNKEEEKKKECENIKCIENSFELANLRRKYDELKKDYEKLKLDKKNIELMFANINKELKVKEKEPTYKKEEKH